MTKNLQSMNPKIKNTELFAKNIVAKCKLLLIDATIEDVSEFKATRMNNGWVIPVIISDEPQPIEDGDWYLKYGRILTKSSDDLFNNPKFLNTENKIHNTQHRKVLATRNNFLSSYLQAISDGTLKNGDELYLKCQIHKDWMKENPTFCKNQTEKYYEIFLTNNHFIIFKEPNEQTWYDIFKLPSHYTPVQPLAFGGRGNHSVNQLEDIVENYYEQIHQLRVQMQNAIDNYNLPTKK